jgi:hypothetical protein
LRDALPSSYLRSRAVSGNGIIVANRLCQAYQQQILTYPSLRIPGRLEKAGQIMQVEQSETDFFVEASLLLHISILLSTTVKIEVQFKRRLERIETLPEQTSDDLSASGAMSPAKLLPSSK